MADFLDAVQVGAGLRDMAFKRQERAQQLRGEAALQQIKERQLAAQAEYLTQQAEVHFEQAKTERATRMQEQAMAAASTDLAQMLMKRDNKTAQEVMPEVLATMAVRFPGEAQKLAAAYENALQGAQAGKARPLDPSQVAANTARATASLAQADLAKVRAQSEPAAEQRRVAQEKRLTDRELRLSQRFQLNESDRAKIKSIYKRIDTLTEDLDNTKPTTMWGKPNAKHAELTDKLAKLQAEADTIAGRGRVKTAERTGQRRVRSPDGMLGWVPEEDLEDAIAEGYELIEEGQ